MTPRIWLAGALLALSLAPRLATAQYWRYETESGAIAFTDDPKSIPAKYKDTAKPVKAESLFDYDRLSVVDPIRPAPAPAQAPRGIAPAERSAAAPARETQDRVSVDVGGVRLDLDADADEPIYVDKEQYTDADGNYFDHGGITAPTTVIRRGDKPIAYIDER